MKTEIENKKKEIKQLLADMVVNGKSLSEMSEAVSSALGTQVSEADIKRFIDHEFGLAMDEKEDEKFDPLADLLWLYKEQKLRVKNVRKLEIESGLPLPQCRDDISLLAVLLTKLLEVMKEYGETPDDIKRKLFENYLK